MASDIVILMSAVKSEPFCGSCFSDLEEKISSKKFFSSRGFLAFGASFLASRFCSDFDVFGGVSRFVSFFCADACEVSLFGSVFGSCGGGVLR